jgi:hypothetical protein
MSHIVPVAGGAYNACSLTVWARIAIVASATVSYTQTPVLDLRLIIRPERKKEALNEQGR